jgi:uncharacterized protein (DUF983 family)
MNQPAKNVSIFSNRCPECHQGKVFNYFFFINKRCPHCNFLFEREEGYFLSPMIISYGMSLLLTLPLALLMIFKYEMEFAAAMSAQGVFIVITGPILYRYAKLMWLHLETRFDQKMQAEKARGAALAKKRDEKIS